MCDTEWSTLKLVVQRLDDYSKWVDHVFHLKIKPISHEGLVDLFSKNGGEFRFIYRSSENSEFEALRLPCSMT